MQSSVLFFLSQFTPHWGSESGERNLSSTQQFIYLDYNQSSWWPHLHTTICPRFTLADRKRRTGSLSHKTNWSCHQLSHSTCTKVFGQKLVQSPEWLQLAWEIECAYSLKWEGNTFMKSHDVYHIRSTL